MNSLGIKAIASYIPGGRRRNMDLAAKFDLEAGFLRDKIGVLERAVKGPGQNTSDLAFLALRQLMADHDLSPESIQALVVVTQNPDANIPHISALVHGRAGLSDTCAAFDISLGCSGYVYSLSILKSFMQANDMKAGVLVTADPYSAIIDDEDRNTALLFGDAATATLVTDNPAWLLEAFSFGSRGKDWSAIHTKEGRLVMDGRGVFNFAATTIPADIRQLLEGNALAPEQVDLYIMHQGSRFIVKTISDRLKQPMSKFPVEIENCGNTVSSTIPLIIEKRLGDPSLRNIVLSGFGVGLSWASCICRRAGEEHVK
jgi:3-oxoacyl-[acyl-carrier-protein] synthase-3